MQLYYPLAYKPVSARTVAVSAGAAFFAVAALLFIFSLPSRSTATVGTVASALAAAPSDTRPLEIHIAADGLVLLRSARVVSVSGNSLVVSTAWGRTQFEWVINTNPGMSEGQSTGTRFLNSQGGPLSPTEVGPGDLVTLTGTLDGAAQEPTLKADSVRKLN